MDLFRRSYCPRSPLTKKHLQDGDDYSEFADFCFKEFGDRVKKWVTINEPSIFATHCYQNGINAPGRCSPPFGNCTAGDSAREPYIVAHNLLLAHSRAVQIYRSKYQLKAVGAVAVLVDCFRLLFLCACMALLPCYVVQSCQRGYSLVLSYQCHQWQWFRKFWLKNSINAHHGQVTIGTLILQNCAVGLLFALL